MDQFVSVGEVVRLACNVSGSEPISYQWLKDGEQLQDDRMVSGSNDSVLVVDPVEGDDFGGYRCNASNDVDQVLSDVAMVTGEYVCSDVHISLTIGMICLLSLNDSPYFYFTSIPSPPPPLSSHSLPSHSPSLHL